MFLKNFFVILRNKIEIISFRRSANQMSGLRKLSYQFL